MFYGKQLPDKDAYYLEPLNNMELSWEKKTGGPLLYGNGGFAYVLEQNFDLELQPEDSDYHIIVNSFGDDRRSDLELASIIISVFSLGIIPGYTRDHRTVEFAVTKQGEQLKTYRYDDYTSELYGWPALILGREIFLPLGCQFKPPSALIEMYDHIIKSFLYDFSMDLMSNAIHL